MLHPIFNVVDHDPSGPTNAMSYRFVFAFPGFSDASDAGGQLNVMAAGESGVYSMVRSGIEAGGRPVGADGLQTFGGVRALARYVKIQAVPASGGSIVINEASVVAIAGRG